VEPTTTPWRVLEDPKEHPGGSAAPGTSQTTTTLTIPRSALALAGAAIGLAMVAYILAFGVGSDGTVVVDGGVPLGSPATGVETAARTDASAPAELVVEIVGAVVRPGVYRVPPGSRIGDLVDIAGGYGARVDADRASRELNLAALLRDGEQVRVPSRDDEPGSAGQPAPTATGAGGGDPGGPVDLNRATSAELEALPGIGPVTAGKILAARDEQPFANVDELRGRKLVGEKTFAAIKDLVVVR
jgi:competence protein ComEA